MLTNKLEHNKFKFSTEMKLIAAARHYDPFSVLGVHRNGQHSSILVFRPRAESLRVLLTNNTWVPLERMVRSDFFFWAGETELLSYHPEINEVSKQGDSSSFVDPYSFLPVTSDEDLEQFHLHEHWESYRFLGAHSITIDGFNGILFAIWAPNAERVSVVGDFNHWDGRVHQMRNRGRSGVWEIFLPLELEGQIYKFEMRHRDTGTVQLKSDPYGRYFEMSPGTASRVWVESGYEWNDEWWEKNKVRRDWLHEPLSIYEVHLGSWMRTDEGGFLDYRTLAHRLVEYVKQEGFTHIQLLPITEHPFGGSWGYQVTGYFAPTSRFGNPEDFKYFVDWCHQNSIGVILDWVPAHFPKDAHGLACFDGESLYEYSDSKKAEHKDWGTLIFDYRRREVRNFLFSSAHYWLSEFHVDGLRVDAVASMIYLDYSREAGEWSPNEYGGNENLEAIDFIRRLNTLLHEQCPGALVIAEESTAWPLVSAPVYLGGLGFSMKWNMGWMNDTLSYFEQDPIYRHYDHQKLTFSLLYAFSENFVLPLSHDEVVHGKHSILNKMPGDDWQRFANVRLLYVYFYTHPGKKLLFMGNEFAQGLEWNNDQSLDWHLTQYPYQKGVQKLVGDLNRLYRADKPLHCYDFDGKGFRWIDCHDNTQSVISFLRYAEGEFTIVVLNFTPVVRADYRIGVPEAGRYQEIFNSDSLYYEGSNVGTPIELLSQSIKSAEYEHSLVLTLPPLAGLVIKKCT